MAHLERVAGGVRLLLEGAEVDVVASLAESLALRIDDRAADGVPDAVLERLAPTVSRGDKDVDEELRSMFRDDLLVARADRLRGLARDLRGAATEGSGIDRVLDREDAMRIVETLNDLRISIAASIGYDEQLRDRLDPGDRRGDAIQLLDALAWLQGGLIEFIESD
jgi:hypothetical protein